MESKINEDINLNDLPFIESNEKDNNNQLYNIKIYHKKKESIIFHAKIKDDLAKRIYKKEYNRNDFIMNNQYFNRFSSLEEIFKFIEELNKDRENVK